MRVFPLRLKEEELVRWGQRIGREVTCPVFLGLEGPLGAGKSVLARAIAAGAGVEGPIPSPTFNLVFRYPARDGIEVVHMDLFRLQDPSELRDLGWDELLEGPELVLVEWPERAGSLLPPDRWEIGLRREEDDPLLREVRQRRVGNPPPLPPPPQASAADRGRS